LPFGPIALHVGVLAGLRLPGSFTKGGPIRRLRMESDVKQRGAAMGVRPLAVTKRAIVGAAFLIVGAGLLFHGLMPRQPAHDQNATKCADVIENSPCSPRQQRLYYYVEPMALGGVFGGK
jgi:hypothetical protein